MGGRKSGWRGVLEPDHEHLVTCAEEFELSSVGSEAAPQEFS